MFHDVLRDSGAASAGFEAQGTQYLLLFDASVCERSAVRTVIKHAL